MSLVLGILSVLGVALIVLITIYVYHKYRDDTTTTDSTKTTPDYPPDEYMKEIGTKCPDLWTLTTDNTTGKYTCVNSNKVPVATTCPSDATATFNQIKGWPLKDKELASKLKERCDWIEKCGPADSVPASWIGIADLC